MLQTSYAGAGSLSSGAIAGIVVGGVLVLTLLLAVLLYVRWYKAKSHLPAARSGQNFWRSPNAKVQTLF